MVKIRYFHGLMLIFIALGLDYNAFLLKKWEGRLFIRGRASIRINMLCHDRVIILISKDIFCYFCTKIYTSSWYSLETILLKGIYLHT